MKTPPANLVRAATRVLCADDSPDVTLVLRMMIDEEAGMRCVGCLSCADGLVSSVRALNPKPDVVVLDATMPGKNPLEAMGELLAEFPQVKVVIYSGHDDAAFVAKVLKAGAWGCVCKKDEPEAIVRAVRDAAAGYAFKA